MNAKAGGIPWAISKMPCVDKPTMVCSYSMVKIKGDKYALGFAATMDRDFSIYQL